MVFKTFNAAFDAADNLLNDAIEQFVRCGCFLLLLFGGGCVALIATGAVMS